MNNTLELFARPMPYQPGTISLWSDGYIAQSVLKRHLDGQIDSGSRKEKTIKKTVEWLFYKFSNNHNVLDIGCGPGLYAKLMRNKGFRYTGIDISPYQIDYARKFCPYADVSFQTADIRDWDSNEKFDLVLMLYGIYSFYSPEERSLILDKIRGHINPGGCVVTEVFTEKHYENRLESNDWEYIEKDGFWRPNAYVELNSFQRYDEQKLILVRTGIIENRAIDVWNSWIQIFDKSTLKQEFENVGFSNHEFFSSCTGQKESEFSDVLCMCSYRRE